MGLNWAGRLAGVVLLATGLTGCIDAKVDVTVTSMTNAKAVMTQVMAPEFYAMVKTNAAQTGAGAPAEDEFCSKGELTENKDGSATCVLSEEGPFAGLSMGNEKQTITFTPAGPGLVRVALPTADMKSEIGVDDKMDEETRQMIEAFFKDHAITLHFAGLEVTDTNMTLSADKKSAEQMIPFLGLIDGTADLPDELYAVVRVQ
ncbi:hypothetical protein ABIB57_003340 [Devosia sp. UYZn731]|uniref:hypothetical protein n=1 Tax=Devosia sp. UYZn731 TaxID=3156345 RepID=UPI00339131E9